MLGILKTDLLRANECSAEQNYLCEIGIIETVSKEMNFWLVKNVGWLVGWVLWHYNLCKIFNAKSIFIKIVSFQIIQFRTSTQFKCKYSLIVKNISISSYSV